MLLLGIFLMTTAAGAVLTVELDGHFMMLNAVLAGIFVAEFTGYWWHRCVAHEGALRGIFDPLDAWIRNQHFTHHQIDYHPKRLRPPGTPYNSAKDLSWYVLIGLDIAVLLALFIAGCIPLLFFLLMLVGGIACAYFISELHKTFHTKDHEFHRYGWIKVRLVRHDLHHYRPCNYGIVFSWMDILFRTFKSEETPFPRESLDVFKGFEPKDYAPA